MQKPAIEQHRSKKAAFTLIELLVVMAIITALAAILLPVFATTREKARQARCLSNEKQIGMAFQMYVNDNDEHYPYRETNTGAMTLWPVSLYPYTKNWDVFKCASDPSLPKAGSYVLSYAASQNVLTGAAALSDFTAPIKTVIMCEQQGNTFQNVTTYQDWDSTTMTYGCDNWGVGPNWNYSGGSGTLSTGPMGIGANSGWTMESARHIRGSNFLMADGHAKWLFGSQVSPGLNAPTSGTQEQDYEWGSAASTDIDSFVATFSVK
jgi:prepilin-type N-terminal cleavage/methylation domain-containing protein/prepilin-type processing-associated H-X9-DG protein